MNIYVGNLSRDVTEDELQQAFEAHGQVATASIITDRFSGESRGFGFVEMPDKAEAQAAITELNGKDLKGNVLRIAPHSKLASEEAEERRFKEEQELNVPLITITRPISYAKAKTVKNILDQVISRRGNIIVDDRTNTLVIKEIDLPDQQRAITELINTLDQPTPQVEIEARIIETTKQFERSLGIQWGFSGIADALTGTTTDLIFPNNFKIDGDLISGGGFSSELPNEGWAVNLPAPGANAAIG